MPLASSNISPCCSIPVDQATWCGNKRLIRISPGNAAFESVPPDTDNPNPRGLFVIWTGKQQSICMNEKKEKRIMSGFLLLHWKS